MKTVKVVCGIIYKDGKIFIARRKPGKSQGGYWEFPGGKIEGSEKPEIALIRELKEEIDMEVIVGEYIGQNIHHYENISIELMAYTCEFIRSSFLLTDHDDYCFVYPKDIIDYNIAPADLFFLDLIRD